jgi:hypothetical protein
MRLYRVPVRDCGLASLEFILSLPILLVIVLFVTNMVTAWQLKLDVTVVARSAAHIYAGILDRFQIPTVTQGFNGKLILVSQQKSASSAGSDFLSVMRGSDSSRTNVLNAASIGPTGASASTIFIAARQFPIMKFLIRDTFAVVATPIWERQSFPVGYDRFMRDQLKGDTLSIPLGFGFTLYSASANDALPDIFPKSR